MFFLVTYITFYSYGNTCDKKKFYNVYLIKFQKTFTRCNKTD